MSDMKIPGRPPVRGVAPVQPVEKSKPDDHPTDRGQHERGRRQAEGQRRMALILRKGSDKPEAVPYDELEEMDVDEVLDDDYKGVDTYA